MDDITHSFYGILHDLFDNLVPIKTLKTDTYPAWYSSELRRLIKEKKISHLTYKKNSTTVNYLKFSELRARCKYLQKQAYLNYIKKNSRLDSN